ncbi:MAG: energy transducer TonB [Pseudomonadota bacterium]
MNQGSFLRLPVIVMAAIAINAVMFGIIQFMVVNRQMRLTDTNDFDIANFIRMHEQSREVRSRRDPKAPQKPDTEAQQELNRLAAAPEGGTVSGIAVDLPAIDIEIDTGGGIQIARELTPLVRIPARYPENARLKGVEGYVTLRFTVTETGAVADPVILRSDPPGVFDRSALRAVLKWKYQPQLADGKPVSVVTRARVIFKLMGKPEKEEYR